MTTQQWIALFAEQIKETRPLEWIAVILAVAEVLLARNNNVWLYPSGIISTFIYVYLMSKAGLFAEAILNIYYLVMSFYGWFHWLKRKNEPPLPVTKTKVREWLVTAGIVVTAWIILYLVLKQYTSSTVPAWDAFVSATAWAGMWLLARRKIENWLLLNLSNICAIPLLFYKRLPLTACLTIFLFIVAIFGYFEWLRIYRTQKAAA